MFTLRFSSFWVIFLKLISEVYLLRESIGDFLYWMRFKSLLNRRLGRFQNQFLVCYKKKL